MSLSLRTRKPVVVASPFSKAQWIWPEAPHWDLINCYALFRKAFTLDKVPTRAPLLITADQAYQLFVNGRFVGRGPARGYQHSWPYDEIDVAAFLKKGRNIFAVRAYNPGFSNFQYLSEGLAGLLVAGRWGKTEIYSDASWKSVRQESVSKDTVPTSMQLFPQEHIDLRMETGNWLAANFDDSAWKTPTERGWNSAPWFALEPRGIPMLKEEDRPPMGLIGVGEGASTKGYERVRDVVGLRYLEERGHRATQEGFAPLEVKATGKGRFRSYLFDFGKTMVGSLTFEVEGARGGEIVDTYHTETIDTETLTPDQVIPTHCRMAFGDRLICRAGDFTHPFFHFYGFRFLCVTVRDAEKDFQLRLKLNWVGYPLERKGVFESSDHDLERIWETCAWTQQCCSLDAYVDTPWREQAQWWGDARVQAWNTFYFAGDARLFRRGIAQIAGQTTSDGVTYGHAPTMAHNCILPDFTLIWMLTLWDYYWQTGSTEALTTHHATVQKALDYFREHTDPKTGLAIHDDRYWLFLDWTEIFKDGAPSVYNLWLVITLEKLALLYRKAKLPREAAPLEAWARKVRMALGRLVNKQGLMRDGIDRKGKIVETTSIHAQTLALMADLKGVDAKAALDGVLMPYIREEIKPKVTPSSYWITYVFSMLIERGYSEEVVAFIKKHWLPMAEHGTTWELFDPKRGDTSFSHAWSAHPLFHLMNSVGGITQTGAAWSEILFKPVFIGTGNRTVVPSPHGLIRAEWKKAHDQVEVKLQLPKGVKAQVELPGVSLKSVAGSEKWVVKEKAR